MVLGIDKQPGQLAWSEVAMFGDYFTRNLILRGAAPVTLRELVSAMENIDAAERLTERLMFVVAEGEKLVDENPAIEVNTRLVYVWRKSSEFRPDVMLSTTADPDSSQSLMQLIAWSEVEGAFHYFERRGAIWLWAGNSRHALTKPSRGLGPFDSHINGSLVMKELKQPWTHWHSFSAGVDRKVVFPTEKIRSDPLFRTLAGAEDLEVIVKNGVREWTTRRVQNDMVAGRLRHFRTYARQMVTTTSINLVSTETPTSQLASTDSVALPISFFIDSDALAFAIRPKPSLPVITVNGASLQKSAMDVGVHVEDEGGNSVRHDTHFAFLVPERAFEDLQVSRSLVSAGVLSPRLILCLTLLDFPNPIFSRKRASMLRHFPREVAVGDSGSHLDRWFIESVKESAVLGSPGHELLSWWSIDDLEERATHAVLEYLERVQARLTTPQGLEDLVRLAEYRRQRFRLRKLNEFRHTTARHDNSVRPLMMTELGTVVDL